MGNKQTNYSYLFDGFTLYRKHTENNRIITERLLDKGLWDEIPAESSIIEGAWKKNPEQSFSAKKYSIDICIDYARNALSKIEREKQKEKTKGVQTNEM